MADVGVGKEPTVSDLALVELTKRFSLEKQVELLQATAERVVGQISLVGTVFAAAGLVSTALLVGSTESRWLAYAAVGIAVLAVLLALATQVVVPRRMAPGNLVEVKKWYQRYTGWRMYVLAAATWLLVVSFVSAAAAVVVALAPQSNAPTLSGALTLQPASDEAATSVSVDAVVRVSPAATSEEVTLVIVVDKAVLAKAVQGPAGDGTVIGEVNATGIPVGSSVEITATTSSWICTLWLTANASVATPQCAPS